MRKDKPLLFDLKNFSLRYLGGKNASKTRVKVFSGEKYGFSTRKWVKSAYFYFQGKIFSLRYFSGRNAGKTVSPMLLKLQNNDITPIFLGKMPKFTGIYPLLGKEYFSITLKICSLSVFSL